MTLSHDHMPATRSLQIPAPPMPSSFSFLTLHPEPAEHTTASQSHRQILARRVSSGSLRIFLREPRVPRSKRTRIVLKGFRRSPTCNLRAKRHSPFEQPTGYAHFRFLRDHLFSHSPLHLPLRAHPVFDNLNLALDQHVQTFFPHQGSCGQVGQTEQEVVS